jgi:hypothetical protein
MNNNNQLDNLNNIFNQEINNVQNINDIINLKKKINNDIFSYLNKIDELKKLVIILEEKLYNNCPHDWKRDYTYCGEHSQFQCSICGLYK